MEFNEVIKRRRMVRAFTGEPLAPGVAERLLHAANRAPSAGFSQGYSFLVLEGGQQSAPLWQILYAAAASADATEDEDPAQVTALSRAPLVIVPLACKDIYLDRYAEPGKGWTDRDSHAGRCRTGISTPVSPRCSSCWPWSTRGSAPCSSASRLGTWPISAPVSACRTSGRRSVPSRSVIPILHLTRSRPRPSDRRTLGELVHRGSW